MVSGITPSLVQRFTNPPSPGQGSGQETLQEDALARLHGIYLHPGQNTIVQTGVEGKPW